MVSKISKNVQERKIFIGPMGRLLIVCLATSVLSGLSLIMALATALYTQRLASRQFPSLVQMNDGTSTEIVFHEPNYTSPETIKSFVSNTLYHTMSQTSYGVGDSEVSSLNPDRDKATPVPIRLDSGEMRAITQNAMLATEAMEPKFAEGFRKSLAAMTNRDVFNGREEVLLDISRVKAPEPVLDENGEWAGEWTVDIIAMLRVYRLHQGEISAVAFNKHITVVPISSPLIHDVEKYGELAVSLNAAQAANLQIANIEEIALTEVFQ